MHFSNHEIEKQKKKRNKRKMFGFSCSPFAFLSKKIYQPEKKKIKEVKKRCDKPITNPKSYMNGP